MERFGSIHRGNENIAMDIKRGEHMYIWEDRYVLMTRGDTLSFGVEIEGLDQDLDTAFLTCKRNHAESAVFQKSLGDGITKRETGVYVVRVAPEDTEDLEPGKYYYDLQLGVNGDIFTVLKGVLELERDVTRGDE